MKSFDDVTRIANINIKEEMKLSLDDDQIPATSYPPEGKEMLFVSESAIERIVKNIAMKHNLTIGDSYVEYLALSLQERLRTSIEQLVSLRKQRVDFYKHDFPISENNDTAKILNQITDRENEEHEVKKKHDRIKILEAVSGTKDESKAAFLRDQLSKVNQEDDDKRINIAALQFVKPPPISNQVSYSFYALLFIILSIKPMLCRKQREFKKYRYWIILHLYRLMKY